MSREATPAESLLVLLADALPLVRYCAHYSMRSTARGRLAQEIAEEMRAALAPEPAAPRCQCTHEAGDSPCPVHGEDEEQPAAPRVGVVAGAFRPPWLVVIKRETFPVEVTPFETEAEARAFEEHAGRQWSESYVCKVVKGPLT